MKEILENLLLLQELEVRKTTAAGANVTPAELRDKIPAQVLLHCDQLKERGKKAIAFVRNGVCSQCHMKVALGLLALLARRDNLYRCANCGTYLYLAPETPALQAPPRATKPGRRGRPPKVSAHVA